MENEFENEWNNFEQFCKDNELSIKEMFKLYYTMTKENLLYPIIKYFDDGDGYIK